MSGKFIVVFKQDVTHDQVEKYANELNSNGGEVLHRYDSIFNGFSATIPDQLLMHFQCLQEVDYIEPDQVVTAQ